ncbi:guanosine polyphosphate pyrophosphohydrolase/synthetase, partial [Genlisea aurea]
CMYYSFKSDLWSTKLLNKLEAQNSGHVAKVDIAEIKKAIYCCKKYHANQKRNSGEPFYSHPLEVAYMVSNYIFKTDIIITSILHDTLEDTTLTREKILSIFGPLIADQV